MKKLLTKSGKPYYRLNRVNNLWIHLFEGKETLTFNVYGPKVNETSYVISFKNKRLNLYEFKDGIKNTINKNSFNLWLRTVFPFDNKKIWWSKSKISAVNKIIWKKAKACGLNPPKLNLRKINPTTLLTCIAFPAYYQLNKSRIYLKYCGPGMNCSSISRITRGTVTEAIKACGNFKEDEVGMLRQHVKGTSDLVSLYAIRRLVRNEDIIPLITELRSVPSSKKNIIGLRKILKQFDKQNRYNFLMQSTKNNRKKLTYLIKLWFEAGQLKLPKDIHSFDKVYNWVAVEWFAKDSKWDHWYAA